MTIDNYFTARFLLSLDSKSELRKECMKEVIAYMRKKETEHLNADTSSDTSDDQELEAHLTYPEMPMFSHLVTSLKDGVVKRQDLERETDRQLTAAHPQQPHNKGFHNRQYGTKYQGHNKFQKQAPAVENGMEMALNATTTQPFKSHQGKKVHVAFNYPTTPPGDYRLIPSTGELYDRKVTPNEHHCYYIPGTKVLGSYTATEHKCRPCSSTDLSQFHPIRCYAGQCANCGLFGHVAEVCRQAEKK